MKIANETEYEKASERVEELENAKKGSPEEAERKMLEKAIKKYDDDFVRMLKENS